MGRSTKAFAPSPRRRPPWLLEEVGWPVCRSVLWRWSQRECVFRPLYTVLEHPFELLPATAHEIKALPGRKTDVRDCEWIADLLRHGLIRPSFIPAKPVRALRDLMRYRKSLVYQHTQEINRLHKVLETANIKLTSVVS